MRSLIKILLRLGRCSSGSVVLESAFALPLAIILMAGVMDFGMLLQTWATGNKGVRDAARYLGSLSPGTACLTSAITNAQNLAIYGNIAGTGSPLVTGWQANGTNNNVSVDCSTPGVVVVTAKFPFNPPAIAAFTFMPWGAAATVTLSARHEEYIVGV
jgi:Flp pilus assembly protein TadG